MKGTAIHQHRCQRVTQVREFTGLRRRAFAIKHGIPNSSMQNWEDLKANGLTERGARRLVKALENEGVFCSVEWLLYGIGSGPQQGQAPEVVSRDASQPQLIARDAQLAMIDKEIALFHQQHVDKTVDMVVSDDTMAPYYFPGDRVAGRVHSHDQLHALDGLDCIVEVASAQQPLLRHLKAADQPNHFYLISHNEQAPSSTQSVKVASAAPIVLMRRVFPCDMK